MFYIRYLATGCSFVDLHYAFRVGKSTVGNIVNEVCGALWSPVKRVVIPDISTEKWVEIAQGFEDTANFPHCIDGKHIRFLQPSNSGSMFYNYKAYFSLVLFTLFIYITCDSNYLFTFMDIGSYGKSSDNGIFKYSQLYAYTKMINGSLKIPSPTSIGDNTTVKYSYVIVADEAFPLTEQLLRPYGGKNLSYEKKIFNYRLSRARRYVYRVYFRYFS